MFNRIPRKSRLLHETLFHNCANLTNSCPEVIEKAPSNQQKYVKRKYYYLSLAKKKHTYTV
jgi:hypothetical protein